MGLMLVQWVKKQITIYKTNSKYNGNKGIYKG